MKREPDKVFEEARHLCKAEYIARGKPGPSKEFLNECNTIVMNTQARLNTAFTAAELKVKASSIYNYLVNQNQQRTTKNGRLKDLEQWMDRVDQRLSRLENNSRTENNKNDIPW